jgi:hypothetical protein
MRDSLKEEPVCLGVRFQPHLIHMAHILLNHSGAPDRGEMGHDKVIIFDTRAKPRTDDVLYDLPEAGLVRMVNFVPGAFPFL